MPLSSARSSTMIEALETTADTDMGPGQKWHKNNAGNGVHKDETANGTGSRQADRIYSDDTSLVATTRDINLTSQTSKLDGTALAFVEITELWIYNKSTTTGYVLTVGAGSNPWLTWLIATGDGVKIPPGGVLHLKSPIDGFAVTASTGDILRLNSGANTILYEIIIIGRSA